MIREFSVPGRPTPKARARTLKTGHSYTPKTTQLGEARVLECYLALHRQTDPVEGPVFLVVEATFRVPRSWSRKKADAADWHISRPDADNIGKLVTDALNGVAYVDDSQICSLTVTKRYGAVDGLHVTIMGDDRP